ncbi:MAG: ArsR family transcriptional regulator [Nanoarchaeota archaeon]
MAQEIVIRQVNKPVARDVYEDIEWLCDSFGFCQGRDIENIATQVIKEVITYKKSCREDGDLLSSEILANELGISIGRVNHHLRNLIDFGLLEREKRVILLRGGTLTAAVREIRKDTERILDEIEFIAAEIDKNLGYEIKR